MPYGFGRGGGYGRGMGFGFRGSSPPWPYTGRGRGGLPRCGYFPGGAGVPAPWFYSPSFYTGMPPAAGYAPYYPQMTREEELSSMKDQAEALRDELKELETEIERLSAEKSKE